MQKIAILYDASQAVLSTFDLDEVLQQILIIARDYFHLQNVAILLLDKESQELYVRSPDRLGRGQGQGPAELGKGITGAAAAQEAARLCARCQQGSALHLRQPRPPARNWPSRSWCVTKWWACWTARAKTSTISITKPSTC